MRSALILSAFAALVVASPTPQVLPIDGDVVETPEGYKTGPSIDATSDPVDYDPSVTVNALESDINSSPADTKHKRGVNDPCGVQPAGSGPVANPDTPNGFLAYPTFADIANSAPTPAGYSLSFSNKQGSISEYGYMGLYTIDSYDPAKCAAECDAHYPCQAFNIYFERDPTVNPASACPNPPSLTNIKCTLYGYPVAGGAATNTGQNREQFQVVITGSNGYNKQLVPANIKGYQPPVALAGAINAPLAQNGDNTYMGYKFFTDIYDPSICTSACDAQTAYNKRHPTNCAYLVCRFVNSYILLENNIPQGFYCSMYSQAWGPQYAVNYGQTRGQDVYVVYDSFSFTNTTQDSGRTC